MRESSITQLSGISPGSPFAMALGTVVRHHRRRSGMTQEQLATPATKSFISLVESGHTVPSLSSLYLIAARLGIPAWDLLDQVNTHLTEALD